MEKRRVELTFLFQLALHGVLSGQVRQRANEGDRCPGADPNGLAACYEIVDGAGRPADGTETSWNWTPFSRWSVMATPTGVTIVPGGFFR